MPIAVGDEFQPGDDVGYQPLDARGFGALVIDRTTRKIFDVIGGFNSSQLGIPSFTVAKYGPEHAYIFWGTWSRATTPVLRDEYLPYAPIDGVPLPSSPEPVNQFAIGPKWKNILSRFAHDVMAFNPSSNHLRDNSTHKTGHLPPTDAAAMLKNKATYQLGRAVIGVAFYRVNKWLDFDAQQLAQYPELVTDAKNWKIWLDGTIPVAEDEVPIPNMGDMMAAICGDDVKEITGLCIGAWVYLLNERIDASTYDSNMNSGGEIRLPDPVWDLWRPQLYLHRVTGSRSEKLDQWSEIMGWFTDAHDHYLESVSPSVEHTP